MSKNNVKSRRRRRNFIVEYFEWHKDYLNSLSTGQRVRYHFLQFLVLISVIIIVVALFAKAVVKLPDVIEPADRFVNIPTVDVGQNTSGGSTTSPLINTDEDGSELVEGLYFDGAVYPQVVDSGRRDGVYTFIVMGIDTASNSTDTMLLITYDTVAKTINAMSLLRDTMVNNSAAVKKLTHVYAYNRGSDTATQVQKGTDAVKLHVSRLTGILPDFYVMLEWEAVGAIVDAVGGVWFDVPYDMKYDDPYQNLHIDQKAGYRLLTGEDAMEVVRHRQNNNGYNVGDVGRVSVQQDFLMAMAQSVLTTNMLKNAPALTDVFFNNVKTDLTVGNILAFAQLAVGIDTANDVHFYSMPYYDLGYWNSASYVGVSQSAMVQMVNEGLNPYRSAISASDLQLMYSTGNGTFNVTNGQLADSRVTVGTSSSSSSSSSSSNSSSSSSSSSDSTSSNSSSSSSDSASSNSSSSSGDSTSSNGSSSSGDSTSSNGSSSSGDSTSSNGSSSSGDSTSSNGSSSSDDSTSSNGSTSQPEPELPTPDSGTSDSDSSSDVVITPPTTEDVVVTPPVVAPSEPSTDTSVGDSDSVILPPATSTVIPGMESVG